MKIRKLTCLVQIVIPLFLLLGCEKKSEKFNHQLWYTYPAEYWNSQSLHLGNGFMGASFFGGIQQEKFALTEGSMWTGGPFSGDWEEYGVNPQASAYLNDIRKAVVQGDINLADSLTANYYLGDNKRFGFFTSIGDLLITMEDHNESAENYIRKLDLQRSLGAVSYRMNGVSYEREYFCSYPNNILAMKFKADVAGSIGFSISMNIIQEKYAIRAQENRYIVDGIIDGGAGRKFRIEIEMIPYGGSISSENAEITVEKADSVVLFLTAATDYKQEFPDYMGDDPALTCDALLKKARETGYENMKDIHIKDYSELYSRVELDLKSDPALDRMATNERWELFRSGRTDTGLKELVFNLGKYLIISSSRPGTLPANLQGKWNTFYVPPWTGNYQANINIQEIYWPCGPLNLIECQEPYIEWTKELVEPGRQMAGLVYGTNGWISHTIGNIWGHTAPVGSIPWGVYPLAPVWHCQHLWEQFNFTQDTGYLAQTAYPIIKEATLFWLENLIRYNDYLIVAPSISAEHGAYLKKDEIKLKYSEASYEKVGFTIPGAAQDAQMLDDLFKMCITSAGILEIDDDFIDSVKVFKEMLVPPMIGKHGQLQEWYEDIDSPDNHHRHISHLYAVCPGTAIHPLTTPELAEAAKKSLNMRGDGRFMEYEIAAGGNWSRCWRIWCWARLMDGDRANKIFSEMLAEQGFENLTTFQHAEYDMGRPDLYHEPGPMYLHFQLDATASTPGFMAEMLLQSHLDELILLPALPKEWKNGSIKGLQARGGYTVDLIWRGGKLKKATISGASADVPPVRVVKSLVDPSKDKRITIIRD